MKVKLWGLAMVMLTAAMLLGEDAKDDAKKMDGTWTMVSGEEEGGKALPADVVKKAKLVIKGDTHDVVVGDKVFKGTQKLDTSKKPMEIDSSDTEGPWKGKTAKGIFDLKDDTFKVCFAAPDKDRPKEFSTKTGTGVLLHVWKKEKMEKK